MNFVKKPLGLASLIFVLGLASCAETAQHDGPVGTAKSALFEDFIAGLQAATDGQVGAYLKEVGGPVIDAFQEDYVFYPASTIKVLEHLHAIRAVQQGMGLDATILDVCPCLPGAPNSCVSISNCSDTDNLTFDAQCNNQVTLRDTLRFMMLNSHNEATNAVQELFGAGVPSAGRTAMNATAHDVVGMSSDTALNHKFGCGAVSNNPANAMTLEDVSVLYEQVATNPAVLEPGMRPVFYGLMLNETNDNFVASVIDQEAAALGMSPADGDVQSFKSGVRMAHKPGNIGTSYASIAGWIELPVVADCVATTRQYVYGVFIDDATNNSIGSNLRSTAAELLRDVIRQALGTLLCARPPVLSGVPADQAVECDAVPAAATVSAEDACDGAVAVELEEAQIEGGCTGTYTIERTWTAADSCGNQVSGTQTVSVEDTTPPVVQVESSDVACLWPPDHRYACFGAADFSPQISDNCSEAVVWEFAGCSSDQPDDAPEGPWNGDGATTDDCVLDDDAQGFCVRAERAASGPNAAAGRRYAAQVVATDACGNHSQATEVGRIHVPHHTSPKMQCQ